MQISFTLNNSETEMEVDPAARLSDALRTELGLTATKVGCNAGDCGSCTVIIDGEPACSCLTSVAQVDGAKVETLEGMGADRTLTLLQKSFLRFGAAQCGICTPGMLMSAKALLDENSAPTRSQVEDALGGVLCRPDIRKSSTLSFTPMPLPRKRYNPKPVKGLGRQSGTSMAYPRLMAA